ncbi:MAG: RluA family pseudouridine synthase [Rhodoferax sp.]|nr:RluA family pseudouridine synthase [Rhodoferax sp.]
MPTILPADLLDEEVPDTGQDCREWRVGQDVHGRRVDVALAQWAPDFTRSYLQQLIQDGHVWIDGRAMNRPGTRLSVGQQVRLECVAPPRDQAFLPEPMALDIVYEDEHLLVINKPAGLVVHPAPGHWTGTLLNGLLALGGGGEDLPRAGIVHRLDRDTTGLMVVARSRTAMDRLVQMMAARDIQRQYLAVAWRLWRGNTEVQVSRPIGRDPRNRLRMAVMDPMRQGGKSACTDLKLLSQGQGAFMVHCRLHTGRTHQIRVHLASLGHPLIGDGLYGGRSLDRMNRQALHAYHLAFRHPVSGQLMDWFVPPPDDFAAVADHFGLNYNWDSTK